MRVMEKMYPFGFRPAILHSDWLGNYLIFYSRGVGEVRKRMREKQEITCNHVEWTATPTQL